MNRTKCLAKKVGFILGAALLGTLTGSTTYAAEISVGVAIHAESDFYEPLTPHGEWVVVGSYGRCWRPARVEVGWRPYCNGNWQRTDAGWYWVSDEPWGWATYHYGRWDFNAEFGWFWVPQIVWAPAWVSWHEGGGYIGWAPLSPSARIGADGFVEVDVRAISPQAFVFVEQRRFLEPIRPTTVVVNNTTIMNKTVNITKIKVANNTVINEGPRTEVIEKVTGHKIQPVQVRELRHKEEAAVPVKREAKPETKREAEQPNKRETKPKAEEPNKHEARPESKPEPKREVKPEAAQPAKHEAKPDAKPDSRHEGKPEAKPEGEKHGQKQEKPDKGSEKKGEEEQTP
jgi:hypothetical protein